MPTRNISLTEYFDAFIQERLESGRYKNVSEIVRAGLTALEQKEEEDALRLERLRGEIAKGRADIAAGRVTRIDSPQHLSEFMLEQQRKAVKG